MRTDHQRSLPNQSHSELDQKAPNLELLHDNSIGTNSIRLDTWPKPGGDDRVRTDDPLLAKQVLSQLSYVPLSGGRCSPHINQPLVGRHLV